METLTDKDFSNLPVSNGEYDKAAAAIRAGVGKVATDYIAMDKKTINPNASEKALHGDGIANKQNMGSEKTNTPN